MEITSSLRKLVKGLAAAKNRRESRMFMAEGTKAVEETINAFKACYLFATAQWLDEHKRIAAKCGGEIIEVKKADIERMSQLQTPRDVIAVYSLPEYKLTKDKLKGELLIALDCIQDPGNLGTIIRLADWFGIHTIIASNDTADCFAPKVVQATMGAIGRVEVCYVDSLADELKSIREEMPVYGTFLNGTDIYSSQLSESGVIVMGNEGNGISPEVARQITDKLYIPPFPASASTVESLNVAVATAVVVSEFRRRINANQL